MSRYCLCLLQVLVLEVWLRSACAESDGMLDYGHATFHCEESAALFHKTCEDAAWVSHGRVFHVA